MAKSNKINTIHDATKVLARKTEKLLDKYDSGENINAIAEREITRRFNGLSSFAGRLIAERKLTGSEKPIGFFREANNAQN